MSNQPVYMSDEIHRGLIMMLDSPSREWTKACDMKNPGWRWWKYSDFRRRVAVTKDAIRHTLSYDFYPSSHMPRVDVELVDHKWSMDVHVWGMPWENKYA